MSQVLEDLERKRKNQGPLAPTLDWADIARPY